ncbi:AraC family transcriptional regulator [Jiulongibacter sediminis]|uniref:helix-turn-helix domain-containing protein n=1 Tax=Jiulongibacter sediminis TaxID=1605367 RepID=UPI0026EEF390|nr:helix-turn-helix domain-containing protein [Jiulongibacter sediminis]
MTELHIKNMVCDRCIFTVSELLNQLKADVSGVEMGRVILSSPLSADQSVLFEQKLKGLGFELLKDKELQLIENLKTVIIDLVRNQEEALRKYTVSAYIEKEMGRDYKTLSTLFSSKEGQTIEHFMIAQKVERVKELVSYNELSISEIADRLHYSSVAHLSNQFKKMTGLTPSQFRQKGERKALDKI